MRRSEALDKDGTHLSCEIREVMIEPSSSSLNAKSRSRTDME